MTHIRHYFWTSREPVRVQGTNSKANGYRDGQRTSDKEYVRLVNVVDFEDPYSNGSCSQCFGPQHRLIFTFADCVGPSTVQMYAKEADGYDIEGHLLGLVFEERPD